MIAALCVVACESPARVKPWRHAPDPIAEAESAPRSPALAEVSAESEVRAARGHTLRIQIDAEVGRLNPLVAPSVWARRILNGPVFEPLIRYVPPDPGSPAGRYEPRLARSWRVVSPPWGGLEVRIELEPSATFHDGRPLTSVDVQFTLDAIRDPRTRVDHLRPMLDDVAAVELITPTEVRLVLHKANGWVLRALAEIPILPMHVYNDNLAAGSPIVGSGPYKVTSTKGGTIHLSRHDRYWAGKVAIPDVEFVYQPDAALVLKEAKRGDFDIIPALIPAHYPEQANAPGIKAAFQPLELTSPKLRLIAFNTKKGPLEDVKIRHALALLVDRKQIVERYFDRLARAALWPIWPGGMIHGTEPPVPPFDPKAAGALLDAAGWIDSDKDGIRDRNGAQLRLVMVGTESTARPTTQGPNTKLPREYLIDAARRIGVVIELKTGSEAWLAKRLEEEKYDLVEMQWTGMVDMDLRKRFGGISPQIDRTLEAMAGVWDPAERGKLAADLATGLAAHWPIAGIVTEAPQGLIHRRVQGVRVWDGWLDLAKLSFDDKR
jgi:ABC-type transport system substrate-binding protein